MAQLMIVEDDKDTNEAITEYLRETGYTILSVYDGENAISTFEDHKNIDLIILDIMLPKVPGVSVLHAIRKKSKVPVIMLTAINDEYTQATTFDEMADDYITKPFSMLLLGKRIEALLRRANSFIDADTIKLGDIVVSFSGYSAAAPWGKIDITPKEIQLLKFFIQHKGAVLSRDQILSAIWGEDTYIFDRTIDTYVKNLRKKLCINNIVTVKGVGYKYEVKS